MCVTWLHIYAHTYLSHCVKEQNLDTESMKACKSLQAYKYFADSFVQGSALHYFGPEKKVLYSRAQVSASMKATAYPVYASTDQQTGDVFGGECTGIAG